MNLGASKVDCYFGCKRLFLYRYLHSPFEVPENKFFVVGNLAHKSLELFHNFDSMLQNVDFDNKIFGSDKELNSLMKYCFNQAVSILDVKEKLVKKLASKEDIKGVQEMMVNYLKFLKETPKNKTLWTEQEFSIDVEGVKVTGIADRVDETDDGYEIVDYKTNAKPMADSDILDSVQIPTYAIWLSQRLKIDMTKVKGKYIFLKCLGRKNQTKTVSITKDFLKSAVSKYQELNKVLKEGTKFTRNREYKYCRGFCDYTSHCFTDKNEEWSGK